MEQNRFGATTGAVSQAYDAGLRAHMQRVYNRMIGGVLATGIVAMIVGSSPMLLELFLGGPQRYIIMFAPLAVIWFGFRPEKMTSGQLMAAFYALAALYGISFAAIAAVATNNPAFAIAVAKAFFIATSMFAGLSIIGYTTKKDLSGMKTFLSMGIIGLVAVSVMNIFFQSDMMMNLVAGAGIILFSGLTVWQTQDMKNMYHASAPEEQMSRYSWAAALNLYISFIAMFQYILHFLRPE